MGSVGNKVETPYLQAYLAKNQWLNTTSEENRTNAIAHFVNDLSTSQQYYYSLPYNEQLAIGSMQNSTKSLNDYMRTGGTDNESYNELIQNLKTAISKYVVTKPMTLYRGVSEAEFNDALSRTETESFKSTSTDLKRANAFNQNQGGYLIEYHTGMNTRMADVNGAPGANENEYLLDSGNKYRNIEKVSDKHIIIYL